VAVGVEIEGRRKVGVVHDTFNHRVYSGIVGGVAACDGRAIAVRNEPELTNALVATGFLPDANVRPLQADLLREVLPRVRDIRRSGCPSLDICGVASGVLDAFYECGLGQWDIAGAAAIAEAAGAEVLLLHSRILPDPLLVVANAKLAAALRSLFEENGVVERASATYTA
jgi:myo-inositol-1(or 4)-monophosphatase